MTPTIHLYAALQQMRHKSRHGQTFSITFRKYDRHRHTGGDLARIPHAILRPAAHDETITHANHKLFITDTDTNRHRVLWRILITELDGQRVTFEGYQ